MKNLKSLFLVALMAMFSFSLASCLGSSDSNENAWDYATYITYDSGSFTATSDNGYIFYISNPDMLKTTSGNYVKRAFVYLKLQNGEQLSSASKIYTASVVTGQGIPVGQFTNQTDTIKNDYGLMSLDPNSTTSTNCWYANRYMNVAFAYNTSSANSPQVWNFPLAVEKVENGELYMRIYNTFNAPSYSNQTTTLFSYPMPSLHPYMKDLNIIQTDKGEGKDSIYVNIVSKQAGVEGMDFNVRFKMPMVY